MYFNRTFHLIYFHFKLKLIDNKYFHNKLNIENILKYKLNNNITFNSNSTSVNREGGRDD